MQTFRTRLDTSFPVIKGHLRTVGIALIALLLVLHLVATIAPFVDHHAQIALVVVEGGIYATVVWLVLTGRITVGTATIVAVAVALRLCLLFTEPTLSSDIYRYVWDGRVQGAGVNPYRYIPNDPALAYLRDDWVWPRINRGDYAPTIYPPAAEAMFYLATRLGDSVLAVKVFLFAVDLATMFILMKLLRALDLPSDRLMIYAWNPLVVWEIASNGHIDAAMIAFVFAALLLYRQGRMISAGMALGVAIIVKFFPLVIAPVFYRWGRWRLPLTCIATVAAGYLLYSGVGWKVFGFLQQYMVEEGIRDGDGFWLTQSLARLTGVSVPRNVYLALVVLVLGAVALRNQSAPETPMAPLRYGLGLAAVATVAVSPVYPWYFCWLVGFAVFVPSPPILWLSISAPLLYWAPPRQVLWMVDVVYGGLFLIAFVQCLKWLTVRPFARLKSLS